MTPGQESLIERARIFATAAHGAIGQRRKCLLCGAEFIPLPVQIRQQTGRYCSRACSLVISREKSLASRQARSALPGGFWRRVHQPSPDACWPWMGRKNKHGYGRVRVNGGFTGAHRYAYGQAVAHVPPGMDVCHRCDNPACCNPAHLFLGTHLENMQDKVAKGRQPRGSRIHWARLTEDDVRQIRRRLARGDLHRDIAKEFGVDRSTISNIKSGRTWRPPTSRVGE